MVEELEESYKPKEILFRDNQIFILNQIHSFFIRDGHAYNAFMKGVSGVGKTVLIKSLIDGKEEFIYISGQEYNTTRRLFAALTHSNKQMTCDLIGDFIEQTKKDRKILIIDEVGLIKDSSELGKALDRIQRAINIPFIIISNKLNFLNEFSEPVRNSVKFLPIELAAYNEEQIKAIIDSRLAIIKERYNGNYIEIPDGARQYISQIVENEYNSSVRVALQILGRCLQHRCITGRFIRAIANQLNNEEAASFVARLSKVEGQFLNDFYEVAKKLKKMPLSTSEILDNMEGFSASRVAQLLTTFTSKYFLLKESYVSMGRGRGRHRIINFRDEKFASQIYSALHPEIKDDTEESLQLIIKQELSQLPENQLITNEIKTPKDT